MTLDELIETLVELRETVAAFDQPQPEQEPAGVEAAGDTPSSGAVVPGTAPSPSPDNVQPETRRSAHASASLVCVPVENIWPVQLLKVLNQIGQFTPGVEELHGAFEPSRFNEALDNIERDQLAIMLC